MQDDRETHWNRVYATRPDRDLSWFEERPQLSFDLVTAHVMPGEPIVDAGGGASRLADMLLEAGYGPLTVVDLAEAAIRENRVRLAVRAEEVTWIVADVTRWRPETEFAVWHDRAVLHFLTDPDDRARYVDAMVGALRPGGTAVIATFADDGPERCSGLPVRRYSPQTLGDMLQQEAPGLFRRVETHTHDHVTPAGVVQKFQASVFERL